MAFQLCSKAITLNEKEKKNIVKKEKKFCCLNTNYYPDPCEVDEEFPNEPGRGRVVDLFALSTVIGKLLCA